MKHSHTANEPSNWHTCLACHKALRADYLVTLENAYWYLLDNYDGCGTEQRAANIIRNVIRKSVPNFLG